MILGVVTMSDSKYKVLPISGGLKSDPTLENISAARKSYKSRIEFVSSDGLKFWIIMHFKCVLWTVIHGYSFIAMWYIQIFKTEPR